MSLFKASPVTCYGGGGSSADGGVLRFLYRKFSMTFVGATIGSPLIGNDFF